MRQQFADWYPRSAHDRERFVTEGLVAVDTNVLLHFYRTTSPARSELLELLGRLGDRLWIPHQVGLEFHQSRLGVIAEQERIEQKLRDAVEDAAKRLDRVIGEFRDHPVIVKSEFRSAVVAGIAQMNAYFDRIGIEPYLSVRTAARADRVLEEVTALLDGKVGQPYTAELQAEVVKAAKERFEQRIPPGYADAKKGDGRQYGDYVLWRQLLDEAVRRQLPVLFITNDQKEDWYRREHGLTLGPRLELIDEMRRTAGVDFHAQTLALFLDTAPAWLKSPVQATTLDEIIRLDELDVVTDRAEYASNQAELHLGLQPAKPALPLAADVTPADDPKVQEVRLRARRAELAQRITELRAELMVEQARTDANGQQESDPRSYARALLARIDTSSALLDETERQLAELSGT